MHESQRGRGKNQCREEFYKAVIDMPVIASQKENNKKKFHNAFWTNTKCYCQEIN